MADETRTGLHVVDFDGKEGVNRGEVTWMP